jgi:hypothetical protein
MIAFSSLCKLLEDVVNVVLTRLVEDCDHSAPVTAHGLLYASRALIPVGHR